MIFWKKQGEWYKPFLHELEDGEFKKILCKGKYYRLKYDYIVSSYFIIIKQLEYNDKKYDWIFTTSTNSLIRYFLFMFTCFVYNVWKLFQTFFGEDFTLVNFKVNMIVFLAKLGRIYPSHYDYFEKLAIKTI